MTTELDLKTHVELAGKLCRRIFDAEGKLLPMIHAIDGSGNHHIVAAPQLNGTDDDKDAVSAGLQKMFKERDIVQYVLMVEAWALVLKDPKSGLDLSELPRPSKHPDRVEVITLQGEDKSQVICGHIEIKRDAAGKPTLGELEVRTPDLSHGRLVGLLRTKH